MLNPEESLITATFVNRVSGPACGWPDVTDSAVMDGGDGVCLRLEILHAD